MDAPFHFMSLYFLQFPVYHDARFDSDQSLKRSPCNSLPLLRNAIDPHSHSGLPLLNYDVPIFCELREVLSFASFIRQYNCQLEMDCEISRCNIQKTLFNECC